MSGVKKYMSDIKKTIEAIREINHSTTLRNWYDTKIISAIDLHELADGYETLQDEHQEMMRFFGIEYEELDGERHWKYKPSAKRKFQLMQNDAEHEALAAEVAELREALGNVKDALDYGRRHSHGMYAFTKMKEGYEKSEALIAAVLDKYKESGV